MQPEQNPIVSYEQQPNPQPLPPESGRSFHVSKKFLILGALIILILFLAGFFLLKNIQPSTSTTAQFENTLLVTVGDQKIYKSDVIKAAGEEYAPSAITTDIQKKYLAILIERTILDQETKKLGITVTETEIAQAISNSSTKNTGLKAIIKYQLLKKQLIQKQITSIQAYLIGYWIPPLNYQQVPLFAQQRTIGKTALQEGKILLQNGNTPLNVVKNLYQKYPLLEKIWSINGYFVNKLTDDSLAQTPRTLTLGQTDIDKSLFALKTGDITILDGPNGAGASLVQVVAVNTGEFTTYENWLENRKKALVTIETAL